MRDVAGKAVSVGHRQRLHEVPAGEVRRADVANLAGAHEVIERAEHFLDRGQGVEPVQLEEIDVIGAEPPQALVDRATRWNREEPTSFGPAPLRKVALVEMSTRLRRPATALPRISSA